MGVSRSSTQACRHCAGRGIALAFSLTHQLSLPYDCSTTSASLSCTHATSTPTYRISHWHAMRTSDSLRR